MRNPQPESARQEYRGWLNPVLVQSRRAKDTGKSDSATARRSLKASFLKTAVRYHMVAPMGIAIQWGGLMIWTEWIGLHYLMATALAVEGALLHNFLWHYYWTWGYRRHPTSKSSLGSFWRFHLSNGLVTMFGNLLLMKYLSGNLGLHLLTANAVSIASCGVLNFLIAHAWAFKVQSSNWARTSRKP